MIGKLFFSYERKLIKTQFRFVTHDLQDPPLSSSTFLPFCLFALYRENCQRYPSSLEEEDRSRIHERTISLRFLGIILRVLRLEISLYNVYITNHFQTTFAQWGAGSKIL